jgi:hypothetical protein
LRRKLKVPLSCAKVIALTKQRRRTHRVIRFIPPNLPISEQNFKDSIVKQHSPGRIEQENWRCNFVQKWVSFLSN